MKPKKASYKKRPQSMTKINNVWLGNNPIPSRAFKVPRLAKLHILKIIGPYSEE
jgi:hypothetical protein